MRDRSLGSTVRLKFTTTDSNGAPVAPSSAFVASDFRIYKDGSATEKATTNGITVTSPFDSVTGRHLIEIDTSNSTGDVGFWASGSAYFVELNTAKTVNSQSVSGLEIGSFSLELQTADVRKNGGVAITQSSGRQEVNVTHYGGTAGTFSGGRPEVNTTHWGGTIVASANVLIDNAITAAKLATDAVAEIADAVWDEAMADHTVSTSYGGRIVRAANSNVTVQITGSQHIAADVHKFQTDVFDADAIAASAVTELQAGLATSANQTLILDRCGYLMAQEIGACSDAGTSAETYAITINSTTYTIDHTGLDATGNRGTATLTKT